ncbi:hypothetical protein PR048_018830 [Dryococelus australis]|uniref:Uncharacterized protein n=1 Tax=Dryococelus australis TaxID=614101 RepID=A0ABQ9H1U7_9NEOP|nr:hypothetical protein PR048_018830 [Dryococelus australis]
MAQLELGGSDKKPTPDVIIILVPTIVEISAAWEFSSLDIRDLRSEKPSLNETSTAVHSSVYHVLPPSRTSLTLFVRCCRFLERRPEAIYVTSETARPRNLYVTSLAESNTIAQRHCFATPNNALWASLAILCLVTAGITANREPLTPRCNQSDTRPVQELRAATQITSCSISGQCSWIIAGVSPEEHGTETASPTFLFSAVLCLSRDYFFELFRFFISRSVIAAVVAERLACSPPTKANRVQFPAGSLQDSLQVAIVPDDAACRRGFLGDLPVSPTPYIPVLLHTSPSSALKTAMLRATEISKHSKHGCSVSG